MLNQENFGDSFSVLIEYVSGSSNISYMLSLKKVKTSMNSGLMKRELLPDVPNSPT